MKSWNVYKRRDGKLVLVDRVSFIETMTGEEVKASLVNHDGYPVDIVVSG